MCQNSTSKVAKTATRKCAVLAQSRRVQAAKGEQGTQRTNVSEDCQLARGERVGAPQRWQSGKVGGNAKAEWPATLVCAAPVHANQPKAAGATEAGTQVTANSRYLCEPRSSRISTGNGAAQEKAGTQAKQQNDIR